MGRAAVAIELTALERHVTLAAADGHENKAIHDLTGADINTVGKWRRRFTMDPDRGLRA